MTNRDEKTGRLLPGSGGRPRGSKNRLQGDFLAALSEDFSEHGVDAIRIVRVERPDVYLKVVTSLMPRELTITDNALADMTDDELIDETLAFIKRLTGEKTDGAKDKIPLKH